MPINPAEFKAAFEAAFIVNRKHLLWNTRTRRTAHMLAYIYRTVANSFPGLDIEYEHNKIDAVLYRDDFNSIEVAIEHENDVTTIGKELTNFEKHPFPLNVIITYTGSKIDWLINPHGPRMSSIAMAGELMLILYPEGDNPAKHTLGSRIPWEYYLWSDGELNLI